MEPQRERFVYKYSKSIVGIVQEIVERAQLGGELYKMSE